MEALSFLAEGLLGFVIYFGLSLLALVAFGKIYIRFTPWDDWALVKEKNGAAAFALTGAMIGFSIALGSAATNSISVLDFVVWAIIALIAQVLAYRIVRYFMPLISQRIEGDEWPAGMVLGGMSIAIGILNAASMSY